MAAILLLILILAIIAIMITFPLIFFTVVILVAIVVIIVFYRENAQNMPEQLRRFFLIAFPNALFILIAIMGFLFFNPQAIAKREALDRAPSISTNSGVNIGTISNKVVSIESNNNNTYTVRIRSEWTLNGNYVSSETNSYVVEKNNIGISLSLVLLAIGGVLSPVSIGYYRKNDIRNIILTNIGNKEMNNDTQEKYDIILTSCGHNKTEVINIISNENDLSFDETKALVETTQPIIKTNIDIKAANIIQETLVKVGAKTLIKKTIPNAIEQVEESEANVLPPSELLISPTINGKQHYGVILKNCGINKIAVIQIIREVTGLGLADAKKLAESRDAVIQEKINDMEAEQLKAKLSDAGAIVEIILK